MPILPVFLIFKGYIVSMDEDFSDGIGPHEGRELELMQAGKKPLAMFHDDLPEGMELPEDSFDPYVDDGKFVKNEIFVPCPAAKQARLRYYFYTLPGEEWRTKRLIEIQRGFFEDSVRTTPELETEIGRLLGYDEADIQIFLERWFATGS